MWVHNLDPTIFSLGPFEVRYYGLVYVLGFLLAWWMLIRYRASINLDKKEAEDLVFYIILGVLIGARLFSVFFWSPGYYLANPIKIFYIWEGGMAFHGGLIGVLVGVLYFSKKFKKNFWKLADIITLPGIFALALGRIANFINGELWGTVTDTPWCVVFPAIEGCRHPVVLYGAIGRFVLFGFCYWLWKKNLKPGFVFWNFLFWIGIGRVFTDFLREDILYAGFSLGQWYSLVIALIGGFFLHQYYRKDLRTVIQRAHKKL